MPIRFRCTYCNRLLGIATRKAGTETICPHCSYTITVPVPTDDDSKTERVNLDDVEEMLGNLATERIVEPATNGQPAATADPPARPAEPPRTELPKAVPPPVPKTAPPPVPKGVPKPAASALNLSPDANPHTAPKVTPNPDDPPLFEGNVDELLGRTVSPAEDDRAKPPPTSGQDAMGLGEPPRMLVISAQKATLLMGAVVVLLGLAFAAGFFLAK